MAFRVLITPRHFADDPEPLKYLRTHGCDVVPSVYGTDQDDHCISEDEAIALLQGVDALIAGGIRITPRVLAAADRLKIIARRGVGFETVDVAAATRHRVVVTITPGVLTHSVADFTFGLMLSIARHIHRIDSAVRHGGWPVMVGTDVWDKTLGIIGLGRVGKGVARRARGFSMRILAHDIVVDETFAHHYGVEYVPLNDLLHQADFVSINAPLSSQTSHILDAKALALMKPTAFLINTARGGLVDEQALYEALRDRCIAGAGLDVFEHEPLPDSPLRQLGNVVLTSHQASFSIESMRASAMMAAASVAMVRHGERPDPTWVVNPEVYA
jgi:D-3-phosphoglycerate dehydrogenase